MLPSHSGILAKAASKIVFVCFRVKILILAVPSLAMNFVETVLHL